MEIELQRGNGLDNYAGIETSVHLYIGKYQIAEIAGIREWLGTMRQQPAH
jgi:hypothetical protein